MYTAMSKYRCTQLCQREGGHTICIILNEEVVIMCMVDESIGSGRVVRHHMVYCS